MLMIVTLIWYSVLLVVVLRTIYNTHTQPPVSQHNFLDFRFSLDVEITDVTVMFVLKRTET